MKLFTVCNSCREQTLIKSNASTRPELIMDKGEEFNIQCTNCNKNENIHVNDVRAKQNKSVIIGGLIVGLIVTLVLWNFFGAIGTISGIIPALIWMQQNNSVNTFNKYLTRR